MLTVQHRRLWHGAPRRSFGGMNTPTRNKQLVHYAFAELAEGNSQPFVAALADDVRWTITGRSAWSRTWEGKQAVVQDLFSLLRDRIPGRIKTVPQRVFADDDHVVVEARGDSVTRDGAQYDNEYCFVIRMSDGRMQELREYADTEFMTRALGEPLAA